MKYLVIILFFNLNFIKAQEIYVDSYNDIYIKDGLVYKVKDKQIFTGIIQFIRNDGSIKFKLKYENGYLTNDYLFYNKSSKDKVYLEQVYYIEKANLNTSKFYLHKKIRYESNGEIKSITYFDKNEQKYLEEDYENGDLIYSCEFKEGKKNGKEFCTTRKCGEQTFIYSNGKKIKNTD